MGVLDTDAGNLTRDKVQNNPQGEQGGNGDPGQGYQGKDQHALVAKGVGFCLGLSQGLARLIGDALEVVLKGFAFGAVAQAERLAGQFRLGLDDVQDLVAYLNKGAHAGGQAVELHPRRGGLFGLPVGEGVFRLNEDGLRVVYGSLVFGGGFGQVQAARFHQRGGDHVVEALAHIGVFIGPAVVGHHAVVGGQAGQAKQHDGQGHDNEAGDEGQYARAQRHGEHGGIFPGLTTIGIMRAGSDALKR